MPEPPERIYVSLPEGNEELRGWAEAISDLHYVGSLIVNRAGSFLPGEDAEETLAAWEETTRNFTSIVWALDPGPSPPNAVPGPSGAVRKVTAEEMTAAQLSSINGVQKRNALRRFRDRFFGYFFSDPSTDEKHRRASEAAECHLDLGAVALDSLGSVPVLTVFCKAAQEGVLVLKNLLGVRRVRGH